MTPVKRFTRTANPVQVTFDAMPPAFGTLPESECEVVVCTVEHARVPAMFALARRKSHTAVIFKPRIRAHTKDELTDGAA